MITFILALGLVATDSVDAEKTQSAQHVRPRTLFKSNLKDNAYKSCAAGDGLVYQATRKGVHAVDANTGKVVWSRRVPAGVGAAPAFLQTPKGTVVVYGSAHKNTYVFDAQSGKRLHVFEHRGQTGVIGKSAHSSQIWIPHIGGVTLVDVESGETLNKIEHAAGTSIVFSDKELLVVHDMAFNQLCALDTKTKQKKWCIKGPRLSTKDGVNHHAGFQPAKVAIDNTHFYVPTNVSEVWAVDATKGKKLWGQEPGGGSFGTHIDDGQLYLNAGTKRRYQLVRLNPTTGEIVWSKRIADLVHAVPLVVGQWVVVATETSGLLFFDRENGDRVYKVKSGPNYSSPCVLGDRLFVAEGKSVRAISIPQRKPTP